jgi:hypothetical protein
MSVSAAADHASVPSRGVTSRAPVLQRKCACDGEAHARGECEARRRKRHATLQRSVVTGAPAVAAPTTDLGAHGPMGAFFHPNSSSVSTHAEPARSPFVRVEIRRCDPAAHRQMSDHLR